VTRRIVIIGDIHAQQERLAATLKMIEGQRFAVALLAGDVGLDPPWISPAREQERGPHDESMRRAVDLTACRLDCPVLFVPGNHDLPDPTIALDHSNIDRRWRTIDGIEMVGFGGAGPTRFGFPYEWTESQADATLGGLLAGREEGPDIFLSHSPPLGTGLDRTRRGQQVGSGAVKSWIGRSSPGLFVCGHIHEAWGVEIVDGVPCLNAGALGEPYAQDIVWVIDWGDDGLERIASYRRALDGSAVEKIWSHA
jgi:Icc-related predicted phosphoesterase